MKTTIPNGNGCIRQNRPCSPAIRRVFNCGCLTFAGFLAGAMLALPAAAAPLQLLSARNPAVPLPAGGDGDSISPVMTPDGRFVVFSSAANDLTPGGNNYYSLNVFLRDRLSNTTVLVSANLNGNGGGNSHSMLGQASTNGQFVVFQSDASNLVPNDTNGMTDIFVRNLATGAITLVSVSTNGGPANGASTDPVMTPDGRYVAFLSTASNLVPNDTNGLQDVFVRDLVAGTNDLVSVHALTDSSSYPVMATPVITPDGRYVAFFSTAQGLVSSLPVTSIGEVYVRDRVARTTTWASTNVAALVLAALHMNGAPAYHPELSDDGRYVAFKAGGLGTTGTNLVLRYDTVAATTTVVNTNSVGWYIESDDAEGPEMTPDGRFIAYVRHEAAATSGYSSVHVWDGQSLTDTLVSDNGSGVPTNTTSFMPVISPDGQFVAFVSNATNLVANLVTNGSQIYLRNVPAATTQLVDGDTNGVGSTDDGLTSLSLSANGRYVAFSSPDGGLVAGDNNRAQDVFVRDTVANATELDSARDATVMPQSGDGFSLISPPSVSADGRWLAFASTADNLVPNDTNRQQDVFVRDLVNGTNALVSVGYDGSFAAGGWSGSAVISTNGRYVVFVSAATNLIAGLANTNFNIYRRDLQTGTTALVSVASNGVDGGNQNSSQPAISPDGRYVVFLSLANNLAPGATSGMNTFWRDMNLSQTIALTNGSSVAISSLPPPSLSSNGRYVAYGAIFNSSVTGLKIRDTQLGADVYTNSGTILVATMDPSGTKIFYQTNRNAAGFYTLEADSIATRSNLFSITTRAPLHKGAGWSDDGRWLTFTSTANPGGGDDGTNKVYLEDFATGTLSLIGLAGPGTNGAAASSDGPAVNGNGRFVVYRSVVTNTLAGDNTAPPNLFLLDRVTGSNTVLAAGASTSSSVSWISRPVISDSGATVAFLNPGSVPVAGDLNRALDVFGAAVDVNAALVDSDGDGIPDWWMMKYFGHPTGESNDLSLASDDADGDGMSNLQEYLAGTSPVDPNSVFRLWTAVSAPNNVSLTWPAVLGRSYQLLYKTNLTDPAWLPVPAGVWVMGSQGYYVAPTTQPQGFYRLFESN